VEVLEDLKFSEKSDIYSFGVSIWELFSFGKKPFSELQWSSKIPSILRNGLLLDQPEAATSEM
jgi:epidermal growth factor receptor